MLSSHNLQHELTSRLKQDTKGHYNYSKKFKQQKSADRTTEETEELLQAWGPKKEQ